MSLASPWLVHGPMGPAIQQTAMIDVNHYKFVGHLIATLVHKITDTMFSIVQSTR